LERMIDLQEELIRRIESLEGVLENKVDFAIDHLNGVDYSIKEISTELNWWGESPTFAKQLLGRLDEIESTAKDILAAS
jgi:hypothetical protein